MPTAQLPAGEEVFLDHIAHFIPEMDAAAAALVSLGFTLTPFTAQQNRTPEGRVPAGTANRCLMLRRGYIELVTAVSQTGLASQLQAAIARYVGVHLVAFSVAAPDPAYSRLSREGFAPEPPVKLRRPVELADGARDEAAFTVLRVPSDRMPEGRIQMLTHHTEEAVWQPMWLDHTNAIVSLEGVIAVVADPEEAAKRFGRFVGRRPERREADRWLLQLDRGCIVFITPAQKKALLPWAEDPPSLPWIASYALGSSDPVRTRERFAAGGVLAVKRGGAEESYRLPAEVGASVTVAAPNTTPSWAG